MPQNIYDNPDFFAGYTQLQRQTHGLAGAPEWPTIQSMLPDLTAKRVVDMGCGFGWVGRWAREQGAASVLGLDVSENMIAGAKTMTSDSAIEYQVADLEVLELPLASFDFAYSALTFHYIEDFNRLVRMVHQALTPGSYFVFEVEHPVNMAKGDARWMQDEQGKDYWPVSRYAVEGERRDEWFVKDVLKYHRTLATTLNTLIDTGFTIRHVEEFVSKVEHIEQNPSYKQELERPMFLIISCQR